MEIRLGTKPVGPLRRAWRQLPEADKAMVVGGSVFATPAVLLTLNYLLRAR